TPNCHAEPLPSAQGRLFACHSERSEESLSFRAQGRLREASLYFSEDQCRDRSPATAGSERQREGLRMRGVKAIFQQPFKELSDEPVPKFRGRAPSPRAERTNGARDGRR